MTILINDIDIINACESSLTMAQAACKTNMHYNTFIRHAKRLNVYLPNQGGKGTNKIKINGVSKIPLSEIIEGKHPSYQTFKLKNRLIEAGIKQNICEQCNISDWQGKYIACELDHIDGDSSNHKIENLRILCPNCHSQTSTFRSKKRN